MKKIMLVAVCCLFAMKAQAGFVLSEAHCVLYEDYLGALYRMKEKGVPKSEALRDISRWSNDPTGSPQRIEVYPLLMSAFDFVYIDRDTVTPKERFAIQVQHCYGHIGTQMN